MILMHENTILLSQLNKLSRLNPIFRNKRRVVMESGEYIFPDFWLRESNPSREVRSQVGNHYTNETSSARCLVSPVVTYFTTNLTARVRFPKSGDMYSPDFIKMLILWTVTPSLVEALHVTFYSFPPPLGCHHLVGSFILSTASGWFHRSGRSRTGMVPDLLALSHLVRYPGYITTLPGKPSHSMPHKLHPQGFRMLMESGEYISPDFWLRESNPSREVRSQVGNH